MEVLSNIFAFNYWVIAFVISMLCLFFQISNVKLSGFKSLFYYERTRNFWFYIFTIFLGVTLIGLGISMVLQSFAFSNFIGGFITVFGSQLIASASSTRNGN